jgi:Zn finger protein HypA/HybF involved in hydrogenase expression
MENEFANHINDINSINITNNTVKTIIKKPIKPKNKILNLIRIESETYYCHSCHNNSSNHKIVIKTIRTKVNNVTVEFEGFKTYCNICHSETFIVKYIKENINISESEYIKQKYKLLNKVWDKT